MIDTIRIVYHDARLLVVDKPSGLLAVPGRGDDKQDCAAARVQVRFPAATIVHRIDRDTSGLLLMALDAEAHRALGRQFEARTVEKRYEAIVAGRMRDDEGLIDLPLRKDFDRPPRHCVDPVHGRPSQTRWRIVACAADRTRVRLEPLTGRSHQIRIHLAALGHPILGDPLYADERVQALAPRLLLHAAALSVAHPDDGRRASFDSPVPF